VSNIQNNTGVFGQGFYGLFALGTVGTYSEGTNYGLLTQGDGSLSEGVHATGGNMGVYAKGSSYGLIANGSKVGVTGQNGSPSGGVAVEAQGSNAIDYLFLGQGSAPGPGNHVVFTVDDSGNVFSGASAYFTGSVSATRYDIHAATSNGSRVTTYPAQQTAPSVEKSGEAILSSGSAVVRFDAAFAATMARGAYMVFITPQGETRGLYVAQKAPSGFVVRENAMGRSNVAFDYRVVARPFSTPVQKGPREPKVSDGPSFAHPLTIRKPHLPRLNDRAQSPR